MLLPVLADDTISYWHSLSFGKRKKIPQQLMLHLQPLVLCLHSAMFLSAANLLPAAFLGIQRPAAAVFILSFTFTGSFFTDKYAFNSG